MVCTKLHSCVDTFNVSNSVCQDADTLVYHRDQDSVYNESRSFCNVYRSLASEFLVRVEDSFSCFVRSRQSLNDLYQLHCRNRIEEVHSDDLVRSAC